MYKALGQYILYKGKERRVIGCSPAHKVDAGEGFAVLLSGIPSWINEKDLKEVG